MIFAGHLTSRRITIAHSGNKLILEHICPFCGESNGDLATYCIKCGNQKNPVTIDDFDTLFSEFNQNLLENAHVSNEEYLQILSNIFIRADYIDVWGDSIKNKILNLASVFTVCKPKARGYERGIYSLEMESITMTGLMIQYRLQPSSMSWGIFSCSASLKAYYVMFSK